MADDVYNWNGDSRYSKHNTAYRGQQRDYSVLPRSPSEALEPDRAPEPPKGSRQRRQHPIFVFLNRLLTFLLLALIGMGGLVYYLRVQFDKPGPLPYPTVFVVPKGDGVTAVSQRLVEDGIVTDPWTFRVAAYYFRVWDKIKAGEYNVKSNATLRDVLDTLVEGKSIQYSVGVPEGLTSYQIVERLRKEPDLVGDITAIPPEGSMLPNTYRVPRGTSREDMIRRMQGEQKKFMERLWPTRSKDCAISNPEDAINLAAIVEKEASRADERPRVAAVYCNRLKKRMRLEADPTVIYGASEGRGTLGRPILRSELDDPNPYNTYRNAGLPPTPIANPGAAAITAVLNPDKRNELFFVADGTGGHAFAETYPEHQKNVSKWRRIEKDRDDQEAVRASPIEKSGTFNVDKLETSDVPLPQRNPRRSQ